MSESKCDDDDDDPNKDGSSAGGVEVEADWQTEAASDEPSTDAAHAVPTAEQLLDSEAPAIAHASTTPKSVFVLADQQSKAMFGKNAEATEARCVATQHKAVQDADQKGEYKFKHTQFLQLATFDLGQTVHHLHRTCALITVDFAP